MKKYMKLALSCGLVFSLAACSNSTSSTTGSEAAEGAVKLGFIGPLSGDYAVYGVGQRNSIELAIKDYNAKGGTQFTLVAEDSQGDSTSAVNSYNKLVDSDGVVGIVGGVLSSEAASITSASESVGTPIISPSATAIEATAVANAFRGCFTDPMQAKAIAQYAAEQGFSKVGILYNKDSDYSVGLTENFSAEFESLGGTVVISESYSDGDKDYNTQLTKIAGTDIDCFYVPNYYGDNVLIAKQASDLGLDVQLFGGDGWDGVLAVSEDSSAFEGVLFTNGYNPSDTAILDYIDKYHAEYGEDEDPNNFAFLAYDSAMIMMEAYDNATTKDNAGIVEALKATDYTGILGHLTFDDNGDPIRDIQIVTVKDGAYTSAN